MVEPASAVVWQLTRETAESMTGVKTRTAALAACWAMKLAVFGEIFMDGDGGGGGPAGECMMSSKRLVGGGGRVVSCSMRTLSAASFSAASFSAAAFSAAAFFAASSAAAISAASSAAALSAASSAAAFSAASSRSLAAAAARRRASSDLSFFCVEPFPRSAVKSAAAYSGSLRVIASMQSSSAGLSISFDCFSFSSRSFLPLV